MLALQRWPVHFTVVLVAVASLALAPAAVASADETLPDRVPLTRTEPGGFTFATTSNFWSVIAVRPSTGADDDLVLWHEAGNYVASRQYGPIPYLDPPTPQTDFLAIDSRFRPLQEYRAEVDRRVGSGYYRIEQAQGDQTLSTEHPDELQVLYMNPYEFVAVRDVFLAPPSVGYGSWQFEFRFPNLSSDPKRPRRSIGQAYIMSSDPDAPHTWVQPASWAAEACPTARSYCQLQFHPPRAGWYAVVVVMITEPIFDPFNEDDLLQRHPTVRVRWVTD